MTNALGWWHTQLDRMDLKRRNGGGEISIGPYIVHVPPPLSGWEPGNTWTSRVMQMEAESERARAGGPPTMWCHAVEIERNISRRMVRLEQVAAPKPRYQVQPSE